MSICSVFLYLFVLWAFVPSAVKMMKMFIFFYLHVFSEVAARWALWATVEIGPKSTRLSSGVYPALSVYDKGECAGQVNQMIKMALKTKKDAVHCQVLEKPRLRCLPSDPKVRKEWMKFILNAVSDCISTNLVVCSLHFSTDSFTNKAQKWR